MLTEHSARALDGLTVKEKRGREFTTWPSAGPLVIVTATPELSTKVAVMVGSPLTVNVHVGAAPQLWTPANPPKLEPEAAVAVQVWVVPTAYGSWQSPLGVPPVLVQLTPEPLTLPEPLPEKATK
jgi:hypothetical protein